MYTPPRSSPHLARASRSRASSLIPPPHRRWPSPTRLQQIFPTLPSKCGAPAVEAEVVVAVLMPSTVAAQVAEGQEGTQ